MTVKITTLFLFALCLFGCDAKYKEQMNGYSTHCTGMANNTFHKLNLPEGTTLACNYLNTKAWQYTTVVHSNIINITCYVESDYCNVMMKAD